MQSAFGGCKVVVAGQTLREAGLVGTWCADMAVMTELRAGSVLSRPAEMAGFFLFQARRFACLLALFQFVY